MQFVGWPDRSAPEKISCAIELVRTVRKLIAGHSNTTTVLVHCAAGIGRTGTFISLFQLMEELDTHFQQYQNLRDPTPTDTQRFEEETIDIFKTVLSLRKERSGMVSSYSYFMVLTCSTINLIFRISMQNCTIKIFDFRCKALSNINIFTTVWYRMPNTCVDNMKKKVVWILDQRLIKNNENCKGYRDSSLSVPW